MEADGDDLDNLFDDYESNDPQPQENVNNENAEADAGEKVPVPKRVVRHPRLKFNPERLCGKRGIPVVVDHFKDVKFKGKGHEKEDLKKLLTTLELWTHRLFPSMKFEDCLRQIEHLGKKRPVKTCVQKIRLDFPILDKDFVHNEEEEDEQPNESVPEPPPEDAFDRLFEDYQGNLQPVFSTPSNSQAVGNVLGTSFGATMSEEQKKRMELNKMLAIERRKARLSAMHSNTINSTDVEDTVHVEPILDAPSSERRNNFLIDYLNEQFTNSSNNGTIEKTNEKHSQSVEIEGNEALEMDEIMKSVDDKDDTTDDVLPNVRNNNFTDDIDNGELGMDELMDLVDEDNRNETECGPVSNGTNNDGKSNQLEESFYEDGTSHDVFSSVLNDELPNNNKVDLGLDELMDLVENDVDEAAPEATSHIKQSEVKDNLPSPQKDWEEVERMESFDIGDKNETDCNSLSNMKNNDEVELRLNELKDSVNNQGENEDSDGKLVENNVYSSDKEEHFDSKESETKD